MECSRSLTVGQPPHPLPTPHESRRQGSSIEEVSRFEMFGTRSGFGFRRGGRTLAKQRTVATAPCAACGVVSGPAGPGAEGGGRQPKHWPVSDTDQLNYNKAIRTYVGLADPTNQDLDFFIINSTYVYTDGSYIGSWPSKANKAFLKGNDKAFKGLFKG